MDFSSKTTELTSKLRATLDTVYASWKVGELSVLGSGLECVVFRASSPQLGDLALRVPWTRWISNDNDPALDARELLEKEELLANHMVRHGVPAPNALARHSGADDFDFLVSEFVWSDASMADAREFGRVVRQIHEAPLIEAPFQGTGPLGAERPAPRPTLAEQIAERMLQRAAVVERLGSVRLALPSRAALEDTLRAGCVRRSILHMDARQANLLTRAGAVVGIVDWSNALIGDPELELARIAEYGALDSAFLEGYESPGPRETPPPQLELTYRLDAALMLAVVFLSEAPDPERARRQIARVLQLQAALAASYGGGVPSFAAATLSEGEGGISSDGGAEPLSASSLYASARWLAVQTDAGRKPSRLVTARDRAGRARCLLPIYDLLPTSNSRYSLAHLLRGSPPTLHPLAPIFGGLFSGYHTEVPISETGGSAVLRAALDEALAGRKDATLVLPYATSALAQAVRTIAPASLLLLEAGDAWLLSTHAELEQHFQTLPARTQQLIRSDERRFQASGLERRVLPLGEHIADFSALVSAHAHRYGLAENAGDLAAYLSVIDRHFREDALLFAALQRGKLVGAALGLLHGAHLYMRMVGNDHTVVEGTSAHFVLTFYEAQRYASHRGLQGVHLGLVTDRSKRARGATIEPLWTVLTGAVPPFGELPALAASRLAELERIDAGSAAALRERLTADGSTPR